MHGFPRAGLIGLVFLSGCIIRYYESESGPVERPAEPVEVGAALRVHLVDGGVALFRDGARVGPEAVEGVGIRYDLARLDSSWVQRVSMDSIAGIESYRRELNRGKTALQGYYTEWVRPSWIRDAGRGVAFEPSDASLVEAMHRWRAVRPEFERAFFETRIPVR